MINHISGIVAGIENTAVVIQSGPIGFSIHMPDGHSLALKKTATVYLYMHWNQENGPAWYGFENIEDRAVFELIISCSGIGPRIGLALLSQVGAAGFIDAIQSSDDRVLSKVSGIGAKKAEQIIVQLKHKVGQLIAKGALSVSKTSAASDWHTIMQALEALSYSRGEITNAVSHLRSLEDKQLSFDQLMRKALTYLAKQQ